MKTIKYLLIFALIISSFTSCLVSDNDETAVNDQGQNLAGFRNGALTMSGISDGSEYPFLARMEVKGPTFKEMTGDVTLTVGIDPTSTAIEGTHFRLEATTITLSAGDSYLGFFPITLLTDGIVAPMPVEDVPTLRLIITDANGGNVVNNGKPLTVNFAYLCFSNLAGRYNLTTVRSNGPDALFPTELITEKGTGFYKTESIYRWAVGSIAPDQGFDFFDICNVISVPDQDLAQGTYGNDVRQVSPGSVNTVTGDLIINYSVEFGGPPVICVGTFLKL